MDQNLDNEFWSVADNGILESGEKLTGCYIISCHTLVKQTYYIQCGDVITRSIFSKILKIYSPKFSTGERYGESFVNKNSDLCSAPVTVEQYRKS